MSRVGQVRYQRDKLLHYKACILDSDGVPTRSGAVVLADLSAFCLRGIAIAPKSKVTGMIDPLAMAIGIGRREVWDRIQGYLNLSEGKLAEIEQAEIERRMMMERNDA